MTKPPPGLLGEGVSGKEAVRGAHRTGDMSRGCESTTADLLLSNARKPLATTEADVAIKDPYSLTKITGHLGKLQHMRDGNAPGLISMHLMPQNLCNHSCEFCSYRMVDNKNSQDFDEGVHLPLDVMIQVLRDAKALGVQGIELTGGGEPLAYPHIDDLFEEANKLEFVMALVTNGTLLDRWNLNGITKNLAWARVSIDAGTTKTYAALRKCPEGHFERAWDAVEKLRAGNDQIGREDFKLGVSFTLSNTNVAEVYELTERAAWSAADNVRLASTFSDKDGNYFESPDAITTAIKDSLMAEKDFTSDTFRVHNLLPRRAWENEHSTQDYDHCPTKDLLCVVEGAGEVYMCCTWTGSGKGKYGNVMTGDGLKQVWEDTQNFRRTFKPCQYCDVSCLYRDRNLAMNALMEPVLHAEFI